MKGEEEMLGIRERRWEGFATSAIIDLEHTFTLPISTLLVL